jgi:hypothetical protein
MKAVMFSFDLSGVRGWVRNALDAQVRLVAGTVFIALALVSIEYDEIIAPSVDRFSAALGAVGDFGRKLTGFAP